MDGVTNYESEEYPVVNIIVDSNKNAEPTAPPAEKEKPVAPPHIVTLENPGSSRPGSSKGSKPAERRERIVVIRGTEVSAADLSPE
jgi:hypothetical protein